MTQIDSERQSSSHASLRTWLFNPFYYVAGGHALAVGLILIFLACAIGSFSQTHFDGVLDVHTRGRVPFWVFLTEGIIDWIVMGVLLMIGGGIISKSRIRAVDVLGTQALARGPSVITALFALLPSNQRYARYFTDQLLHRTTQTVHLQAADPVIAWISMLVVILMTIWMVLLMYRACAVSCNVKGGKAIGVFIAALFLGEVVSKYLITWMLFAIHGLF
ncbi:MAG: hypothetical protein WC975_01280 [Phycisphaerae bacterium]